MPGDGGDRPPAPALTKERPMDLARLPFDLEGASHFLLSMSEYLDPEHTINTWHTLVTLRKPYPNYSPGDGECPCFEKQVILKPESSDIVKWRHVLHGVTHFMLGRNLYFTACVLGPRESLIDPSKPLQLLAKFLK